VSRKRWLWLGVLAASLAAVGAAAWASRDEIAYARIATGYAAKQTCSCLHVSGRTLDSCMADFPPDARGNIDVTQNGEGVRASVLFGAISAEARYEEAYGCSLLD
jgi:hypothetical protein